MLFYIHLNLSFRSLFVNIIVVSYLCNTFQPIYTENTKPTHVNSTQHTTIIISTPVTSYFFILIPPFYPIPVNPIIPILPSYSTPFHFLSTPIHHSNCLYLPLHLHNHCKLLALPPPIDHVPSLYHHHHDPARGGSCPLFR